MNDERFQEIMAQLKHDQGESVAEMYKTAMRLREQINKVFYVGFVCGIAVAVLVFLAINLIGFP